MGLRAVRGSVCRDGGGSTLCRDDAHDDGSDCFPGSTQVTATALLGGGIGYEDGVKNPGRMRAKAVTRVTSSTCAPLPSRASAHVLPTACPAGRPPYPSGTRGAPLRALPATPPSPGADRGRGRGRPFPARGERGRSFSRRITSSPRRARALYFREACCTTVYTRIIIIVSCARACVCTNICVG